MSSFRTVGPPGYEPPTQVEMLDEARETGVEEFDADLVSDLCTLAEGGQLKPVATLEAEVRQAAEERATAAGQKVNETEVDAALHYHRGMREFVDEVNLSRFPGSTPLQRAMGMLKLLSMLKEDELPDNAAGAGSAAKKLNEAMKVANSLTPQERKLLYDGKPPEPKIPPPTQSKVRQPPHIQPPAKPQPQPQPQPHDPADTQGERTEDQAPQPAPEQKGGEEKPSPGQKDQGGDSKPQGSEPSEGAQPDQHQEQAPKQPPADQSEGGAEEQKDSEKGQQGSNPLSKLLEKLFGKKKPGQGQGTESGGKPEGAGEGESGSPTAKDQPNGKIPEGAQRKAGEPQPGSEAGEPNGVEPGRTGSEAGEPKGVESGRTGSEAGEPKGAEPGAPGSEAGEPKGAEPGKLGSEAGEPKGAEPGAPGSEAGEPKGAEPGAPGSEAGEPKGAEPGAPGSEAGEPKGAEPGKLGSEGGEPKGAEPGAPGSEAGASGADGSTGTTGDDSTSPAKDDSTSKDGGENPGKEGGSPTESSGSEGGGQASDSNSSGDGAAGLKSFDGGGAHDAGEDGEDDANVPPPDGGDGLGSAAGHEKLNDSFAWSQQRQAMRFQNLQVAQDLMEGTDKRFVLEASRLLDTTPQLHVCKDERMVPDPSGTEIRRRPMKDLSELSKIAPHDLALRTRNRTLFNYMAVTGKFMIPERLKRIRRKQLIFMLTDGSGSMGMGQKHLKASGFVMNRLKSVLSGDAEMWLSVFDTQLTDVLHASNEAEAIEMMRKYREGDFTGGGTNIGASVLAAHKFILKLLEEGNMYRPEIWVLTDDDTSIRTINPEEVEGTRVHGLAFESENRALDAFCKATGGTYWGNL